MRKILVFVAVFFISRLAVSQQPGKMLDTIHVRIKDTLRKAGDCVINITIARKDGGSFQFPANFIIGDQPFCADLLICIEKLSPDKQKDYMCKSNIPLPDIYGPTLKYKSYKTLDIADSLHAIFCIEKGEYQLKIMYNLRREDGFLDRMDFRATSNVVRFYVDQDKIYTHQALIDYMEKRGH